MRARRWSWVALLVVAAAALVIGTGDDGGPRTNEERARDLAATIRCPTCQSQSALESDAPTAEGVRTEIARRVREGETDAEIRAYFVSRFGEEILLDPPADGVAGLVWLLPALVLVAGGAALAGAFRRWRTRAGTGVSEEDRVLVEQALGAARRP